MSIKLVYNSRSTSQFTLGQIYEVDMKWALLPRGYKADGLITYNIGPYRITPFEFRKFWVPAPFEAGKMALFQLYVPNTWSLVYKRNPMLSLINK